MSKDSAFSHPNFGKEIRVEQYGREVHLIFKANTQAQSNSLYDELVRQLKEGGLYLNLVGEPSAIVEKQP